MRGDWRSGRGALVVLVLAIAVVGAYGSQLALAPGDRAPILAGYDLSGDLVSVRFDKVTLVNFWATWCEPCIREMPALEGLFRRHSDRGLQVVGVVHEAIEHEELVAFVDKLGVTYPVLNLRRRTSRDWRGVATLPVTFLIDEKRMILRRYVGASPEQIDAMVNDVELVLDGKPLGPMVMPGRSDVANPEDRPKHSR